MSRSAAIPWTANPSQSIGDVQQGSTGCRIKGNISKSGKIYRVPGSPSYANTKVDESKGEQWFCSEAEARAAGWRAPKG